MRKGRPTAWKYVQYREVVWGTFSSSWQTGRSRRARALLARVALGRQQGDVGQPVDQIIARISRRRVRGGGGGGSECHRGRGRKCPPPSWARTDSYASQVLLDLLSSGSALSGPGNDGQCFALLRSTIQSLPTKPTWKGREEGTWQRNEKVHLAEALSTILTRSRRSFCCLVSPPWGGMCLPV